MLIERINKSIGDLRRDIDRQLGEMRNDVFKELGTIGDKLDRHNEANDKRYLTQGEFAPWKWAITLIVGGILTAAIAGIMASVISP